MPNFMLRPDRPRETRKFLCELSGNLYEHCKQARAGLRTFLPAPNDYERAVQAEAEKLLAVAEKICNMLTHG